MIPRIVGLVLVTQLLACQAPPPDRETLRSQLPDRPYSGVVRAGNTYYFAGRVGVSEATRLLRRGRTGAEVREIMEGYDELLTELGLGFEDVVQASVFLTDIDDYDELNRVYGEFFVSDPPARTTVAVAALPGDARVEIALIAVRRR